MKFRTDSRKKLSAKHFLLLLLIAWICIFSILIQKRSEPSLCALAKSKVNLKFQDFISSFLTQENTDLQFVSIRYDQNGKIQSITANTKAVTEFQTKLMRAFLEDQSKQDEDTLKIPVGNLSKSPLFYGRGPNFYVKILPCKQADFKIQDQFLSAGINQTLHQIDLIITAEIEILLPTTLITETITASIPLSKTLIVGDVPQIYPMSGLFS